MSASTSLQLPLRWRLSAFYLFYFAVLGAFLPYWGPYLKSRGFSAIEIGQCFAMLTASKLIVPTLWGWLADRTGRQLPIVRGASIVALFIFCFIPFTEHYIAFLLAMFLYGVFWYACLPQFEVITLHSLGDQPHHYSKIRLWGSLGFIIFVVGIGPTLDQFGSLILPFIIIALIACVSFISFWIKSIRIQPTLTALQGSILKILLQPKVLLLLLASFIMQLSHAPYYAFFSIYAENLGYSKWSIGWLWAVGVVAEVVIFIYMHRLLRRFDIHYLLIICFLSTSLRWVLIGIIADNVYGLVIAQAMHALSFGMFHSVMVNMIHENFRGGYHGRGQALYSSISFGAGGAVGSYVSGYVWASDGPVVTFLLASGVSIIGLVLVVLSLCVERFKRC